VLLCCCVVVLLCCCVVVLLCCGVVLLWCCVVVLLWCCVVAVVEALHVDTKVGGGDSLCGPGWLSATALCILEPATVVPAQTSVT
jgi:hypothetical protein